MPVVEQSTSVRKQTYPLTLQSPLGYCCRDLTARTFATCHKLNQSYWRFSV